MAQSSVWSVALPAIQNMHLSISSVGVSSVADNVPLELEPTVNTIRYPAENGCHSGEKASLLVDGLPEETNEVQNAIASALRAASDYGSC